MLRSLALLLAVSTSGSSVSIVSTAGFFAAVRSAHAGVLTVFSMSPSLLSAILDACRSGASLNVILDRPDFLPNVVASNQRAKSGIEDLKDDCHASWTTASDGSHLKLAYLDRAAYLSDTNFGTDSTIFRVDDQDVRTLLAQTLRGSPGSLRYFSTIKHDALTLEAQVLTLTPGPLDVATESFGPGTTFDALARAGEGRLMVGRSEASSLRTLLAQLPKGVAVRVDDTNEKEGINPRAGWCWEGSANSTEGVPNQLEWGYATTGPLCQQLEDRFSQTWARARPL